MTLKYEVGNSVNKPLQENMENLNENSPDAEWIEVLKNFINECDGRSTLPALDVSNLMKKFKLKIDNIMNYSNSTGYKNTTLLIFAYSYIFFDCSSNKSA